MLWRLFNAVFHSLEPDLSTSFNGDKNHEIIGKERLTRQLFTLQAVRRTYQGGFRGLETNRCKSNNQY